MSDYDSNDYHNPKRPRDPKAIRKISPIPEVLRKFCYRCWKAGDLCLCDQIIQVENPLEIGVVFHPREYKNPINTGRLAFLSLKNAWCATGVELDEVPEFKKNIARFEEGEIGILYPSNEAQDLSEAPAHLKCLIVVDGTWNEAKKMIHRTPTMKNLPHYRFTPPKESNYRIRKEPAPHCVSTIESVVTALRAYDLSLKSAKSGQSHQASVVSSTAPSKASYSSTVSNSPKSAIPDQGSVVSSGTAKLDAFPVSPPTTPSAPTEQGATSSISAPPIPSAATTNKTTAKVSIDISNATKAPYSELLDIFDKMVDNQIACKESHSLSRHKDRAARRKESLETGALNWLHLSMAQEQRQFIQTNMSEVEYLAMLEELKTPEAVVEWIKERQVNQLKL